MKRIRCLAIPLLAAAAAATPLHAQRALEGVGLEQRASFPESFGLILTVRELSDGRVVVADPLGGVVAALDFRTGEMRRVGREGGGPGDWRQPDAVHPLPADSTLLVDLGNARLSVFDAAGEFVLGYPMILPPRGGEAAPDPRRGPGAGRGPGFGLAGVEVIVPRGTDAAGRIYYQSRAGLGNPGSAPDSSPVMRWARGEEPPVRVAALRPPAVTGGMTGGGGRVAGRMQSVPLAPQDDWAVAPDGRVAVVRAEPYRVEWVRPDGRVVTGPANDVRRVRVGAAEKERWIEDSSTGLRTIVTAQGGAPTTQFRRGGMGGAGPVSAPGIDDYEWPDALPPFRAGGARIDPRGRLWVERYQAVGAPALYDLFDGRGARTGSVTLPPGRRVVGFGRDAVYAAYADELGLHWLEAYAPPP